MMRKHISSQKEVFPFCAIMVLMDKQCKFFWSLVYSIGKVMQALPALNKVRNGVKQLLVALGAFSFLPQQDTCDFSHSFCFFLQPSVSYRQEELLYG
jgi:hypothetical protein